MSEPRRSPDVTKTFLDIESCYVYPKINSSEFVTPFATPRTVSPDFRTPFLSPHSWNSEFETPVISLYSPSATFGTPLESLSSFLLGRTISQCSLFSDVHPTTSTKFGSLPSSFDLNTPDLGSPILSPFDERLRFVGRRIARENAYVMMIILFALVLLTAVIRTTLRYNLKIPAKVVETEGDSLSWFCKSSNDVLEYVKPQMMTSLHEPSIFCAPSLFNIQYLQEFNFYKLNTCTESLFLLVVIFSKINNFIDRQDIRDTWGNVSTLNEDEHHRVKIMFCLGLPDDNNTAIQKRIDLESEQYGDILQESFIDSYHNQSIKLLMSFKWLLRHNQSVLYILKVTDKAHVSIFNAIEFLKLKETSKKKDIKDYLMMGYVKDRCNPAYFENLKRTNPHCLYNGTLYSLCLHEDGYLLSMKVVKKLYETSLQMPLFVIEDIFIAMLAQVSRIELKNSSLFFTEKDPVITRPYLDSQYIISPHSITVKKSNATKITY